MDNKRFGKELTFRQFYDLLKRHKQYIFNRKIPQWSCLCEICENAIFLVSGINKKLFPESHMPETIHELIATFTCDDHEDCMTGKCEKCSFTTITLDNFNTDTATDNNSTSVDTTDEESCDEGTMNYICYYEWARYDDDKKLQKIFFKTIVEESINLLNNTINNLKQHIHVKRVQMRYYNDVKNNLCTCSCRL